MTVATLITDLTVFTADEVLKRQAARVVSNLALTLTWSNVEISAVYDSSIGNIGTATTYTIPGVPTAIIVMPNSGIAANMHVMITAGSNVPTFSFTGTNGIIPIIWPGAATLITFTNFDTVNAVPFLIFTGA